MITNAPTPRTTALRTGINVRSALRTFIVPQDVTDALELAETLERDLTERRAALRELVECKDMGERTEDWCNYESYTDWRADREAHAHRQPLAWAAARAILQSTGEGE